MVVPVPVAVDVVVVMAWTPRDDEFLPKIDNNPMIHQRNVAHTMNLVLRGMQRTRQAVVALEEVIGLERSCTMHEQERTGTCTEAAIPTAIVIGVDDSSPRLSSIGLSNRIAYRSQYSHRPETSTCIHVRSRQLMTPLSNSRVIRMRSR